MEKEKRQLEVKLDKLDKLSRALQQERSDLQATIKNLSKPASTAAAPPVSVLAENETTPTTVPSTPSETAVNGHDASKNESVETPIADTNGSTPAPESPNLYDSELGRMAKTVD